MKVIVLAALSLLALFGIASATVSDSMYCWVSESEFPVDCSEE